MTPEDFYSTIPNIPADLPLPGQVDPPKRVLSDFIGTFLEWTCNLESPELYLKWAAVNCISGALRRKVHIKWEQTQYANLYTVLVGGPGARKNVAMMPARMLLNQIEDCHIAADMGTVQALIEELEDIANNSMNSQLVGLSSPADLLSSDEEPETSASLTIFSNEFTVFTGKQDRTLIDNLCDWFDCKDIWKYKTKNQGKNSISNMWIHIFAASTPASIDECMPPATVGSGLTRRVIFVFQDDGDGKRVDIPWLRLNPDYSSKQPDLHPKYLPFNHVLDGEDNQLYHDLVNDLKCIASLRGEFFMLDETLIRYSSWRDTNENHRFKSDAVLLNYLSTRPMHMIKLSLLMAAARGPEKAIDPKDGKSKYAITVEDFEKAIELLDLTERKMDKTFSSFGKNVTFPLRERILKYLKDCILRSKPAYRGEIIAMLNKDATIAEIDEQLTTMMSMKPKLLNGIVYPEGRLNLTKFLISKIKDGVL